MKRQFTFNIQRQSLEDLYMFLIDKSVDEDEFADKKKDHVEVVITDVGSLRKKSLDIEG